MNFVRIFSVICYSLLNRHSVKTLTSIDRHFCPSNCRSSQGKISSIFINSKIKNFTSCSVLNFTIFESCLKFSWHLVLQVIRIHDETPICVAAPKTQGFLSTSISKDQKKAERTRYNTNGITISSGITKYQRFSSNNIKVISSRAM